MSPLPFETSEILASAQDVRHGFFGRRSGDAASLNVSDVYGDQQQSQENRELVLGAIGAASLPLARVRQTHSIKVLTLTAPNDDAALPEADAMATNQPGLALGIQTADCAPILFADARAQVIAACHAGWQGAVNGIIAETLKAMIALGAKPEDIRAAIGPTISGENYEVGPERAAEIIAANADAASRIFIPAGGAREHFDLPGFVADDLKRAGLSEIEIAGGCTYAHPERYFSHRYTTHKGTEAGRQISIIALT